MRLLILLLTLLSSVAFAQRKAPEDLRVQKLYVARETPTSSVCGPAPALVSFTKNRIYLDFYEGIYDLEIVKRKRTSWLAVRQGNNQHFVISHVLIGSTPALVMVSDTEILILSTNNFCK